MTRKFRNCWGLVVAVVLAGSFSSSAASICHDDRNFLAKLLWGSWKIDEAMTQLVNPDYRSGWLDFTITFTQTGANDYVMRRLGENECVYGFGIMKIASANETYPFGIISKNGNPTLVLGRDYQSDEAGFKPTILVPASNSLLDILFVQIAHADGPVAFRRVR